MNIALCIFYDFHYFRNDRLKESSSTDEDETVYENNKAQPDPRTNINQNAIGKIHYNYRI